jgi:signal transduction histidine kinase
MSVTKTGGMVRLKKDLSLDELEILQNINAIVTSNNDLDEILQSVHAYLPRLIPHTKSGIFFYHEKNAKVTLHSNIGLNERLIKLLKENISHDYLFIKQMKTQKGWRSTDVFQAEDIKHSQYFHSLRRDGMYYNLGAPIVLGGNFIGTVHIARPESRCDFSDKDLRMLELVANQIGIAVKNALTYEKDLREKEHIINALEQKIKQAERLAALGRAAAIIAHEVKNPLTSIRLSLYSIEKKSAWKMDIKQDLTIVKEAVDRVSRTMEDLLHFSIDTQLQLEEVNLNALLKNLAGECRERYGKGLIIETSLNKPIPPITADAEKLTEVFRNLITNAVYANETSGTVRISTNHSFDQVIITVEDWGSGISPEIQQKIFEPFFTTKQSGTGLGLVIAKKNIEAHRGMIQVESEPGWGTKFIISLPVYNPEQRGEQN